MIKACILIPQIDTSQLAFTMITSVNELILERPDIDVIAFYQTWARQPAQMAFASMMEREVWGFDGVAISTTLKTTERMINCPGPKKKFFYVWNLEWIFLNGVNYSQLYNIYCNPNIELIARTKTQAELITKSWKKPRYIMENFEKNVLKEVICGL